MLIYRYDPQDVFARVPEVAAQIDPVLKRLDQLLEDDQLYKQVRADLGKRYPCTGYLTHPFSNETISIFVPRCLVWFDPLLAPSHWIWLHIIP